jgi:ribA/ribD-fused uncharacterized protein
LILPSFLVKAKKSLSLSLTYMTTNKPTYQFFYNQRGHNGCFSNFYPANFTENNIEFNCSEQYMMYKKACLFKDEFNANRILESKNPKDIKALGRKVKGFDQKIWEVNARKIVTQACLLKFTQNQDLLTLLLDTKEDILVEASPYDKIWGIGLTQKDAIKIESSKWPGKNWLGECLMAVKQLLAKARQNQC